MSKKLIEKIIPVILALLTFFILSTLLYWVLLFLDSLHLNYPVILDFRRREVIFGILIYLKTAIDFAIFMGNLMHTNPGWRKKIAIAFGTSIGNAFGTFLILIVWTLFKEIPALMTLGVFISSVILLKLAEENFEIFLKQKKSFIKIRMPVNLLQNQLDFVNNQFRPVLKFLVPDLNLTGTKKLSFINLIVFSFTIPFILGINDFVGYIPLFEYVNVFGFTLGVMLGHMLLTIGLFLLPKKKVGIVKHPVVLIGGGLAFLAIGIFGFFEAFKILASII